MRKSFKYRLKPNVNQERELCTNLETLRRLYNEALEQRKTAWETERRSIKFAEQSRWFTEAKKSNPWYARLNRETAQSTLARLDKAFQNFFRRIKQGGCKAGYPRFKGRDRFDSIENRSVANGWKLKGDRIWLQAIGDVRIRLHRPIEGKIKQVVVKREYAGMVKIIRSIAEDGTERRRIIKTERDHWYVIFSCDLGEVAVVPSTNPPIGIDVGIKSFLMTSDGEEIANPKHLKAALPALRVAGRAVSRKQKGGVNRRKAVKKLRRLHNRVRNLRKEHHHHEANKLVRCYGLIAAERLDIKNMVKNHRLARAISDAAWGGFLSMVRYKAESAGVSYVEVDPWGTSQECSGCGTKVPKDLSIRTHACPQCGLVLDRDENAARNVLARALQVRTGPADGNVAHRGERRPRNPSVVTPDLAIKDRPTSTAGKAHSSRKSLSRKKVVTVPDQTGCMNDTFALVDNGLRPKRPGRTRVLVARKPRSMKNRTLPLFGEEDKTGQCETPGPKEG